MLSYQELNPQSTVALLPIGCMEQHGPVLPLETDSLIATHACQKLQQTLKFPTYVYPTINYTTTTPNAGYAGTVSVSYDIFRNYLKQVLEGLLSSGFRAVAIINAHGSVVSAIKEVAFSVVHQQFERQSQPLRPVICHNIFDCDDQVEALLGKVPGRHAEWKEFLLVHGIVGEDYFTPERLERLHAFAAENSFSNDFPPVLGIPMEYRSVCGVVGEPLPPSKDYAGQAEALWNLSIDFLTQAISRSLEDFETRFSEKE